MNIKKLPYDFTVCKVYSERDLNLQNTFYFIGKTDEEISLVCLTADAPLHTVAREDGWKGFRIQGKLDFSLIGILSSLSALLAEHGIPIFAVSTFDTDYIFVKEDNLENALYILSQNGYRIVT